MEDKIEVRITIHDKLKEKIHRNVHEFRSMKLALDFIHSLTSLDQVTILEVHIIKVAAGYAIA